MDDMERARTLFLAGIEQLQGEHFAAAADSFRACLALAPGRASALDNLSVCLLGLNQLAEAEAACRESLLADAQSPTPWFNLGLVQRKMDQLPLALASLQKAIELDPKFADSWHQSGVMLNMQKRHPEAISCFETVLELEPGHVEAMCVMAASQAELKFYVSAQAVLEKAIAIAPDHPLPFTQLGHLHLSRKRPDEAIAFYRLALERNPADRETVAYSLAALTGETLPDTAPKDYVASLFDGYADNFESHLVDKLAYKTPQTLYAQMKPLLGSALDMMDLGCGTGLMGQLVKDHAARLVGLDLSRRMLDEAGKKGIYDLLVCGDINDVLAHRDDVYDVVMAADVLIYLGDLSETFALVHRRLRSGGLFAFSVEVLDGDGFHLNPSKRYSHSAAYLQQLAQEHGFAVQSLAHDFLRLEATAPDGKITGYYAVLQKP